MFRPLAPMAPEGGNTKTPSEQRSNAGKRWCFTAFSQKAPEMISLLAPHCKYIFGEETCPVSGKKHLQGYIEFDKKERPIEKLKTSNVHWEKAKGSRKENIAYCSKEGATYSNCGWQPVSDFFLLTEAKVWQKDILTLCKGEPDRRSIHWYWEPKGCTGKTTLARHLVLKQGALYLTGKGADIKFGIQEYTEKNGLGPKIIILYYPRTCEDYVSYAALEEVKDGMFFSGKYKSGMVVSNPPHVIVFANFKPEVNKLSEDRWKITKIS